jgi:excisionase family DNA binding protein
MPRADEFLRVKEAAAMLGVVPNTVRSWGERGKIPEHRHPANNYRLYKKSDLVKILQLVEKSVKKQSFRKG